MKFLELLTDRTMFFLFGTICGFVLCIIVTHHKKNEESVVDEKEMDGDGYQYYVKLPDNPEPIQIDIEEPLGVNDFITLDKVKYKVLMIDHKVNGHTIFTLSYTH